MLEENDLDQESIDSLLAELLIHGRLSSSKVLAKRDEDFSL
jgi:hypothetical protein